MTTISKVASDFFTTISYDIIADRKKHPGVSFSYIGYYNHIQGRLRLLHNNQLRYHCRQKETSWCKFFLYWVLQSYPRSPQTSSQQSVTISLQTERNILVLVFPILGITTISKVASDFFTTISDDIIADRKKHPGVSFSYIGYYNHIQGRLRLLHNNQLRYHCRQKETSWCKFFLYWVLQPYQRSPQTSSQQSVTISLQTERNILV